MIERGLPQVILPAIYLVLSSLEKKFLYVFLVDKELSAVETWEGKSVCGGAKAVIPRSSIPGCFLKMNKIANVSRLFDFLQFLAPLLTVATSLQF